uniref:Uncharacterized protein n=1 Tax=viral metagenome TaxID=1070528 RepID=A0A6M3M8P1_9ZZZZ
MAARIELLEGKAVMIKEKNGLAKKDRQASVLTCVKCGAALIEARSGSGAVLLKCSGCKGKGRVTGCAVSDLPVPAELLDRAEQLAVFPGEPGSRSGKEKGAGKVTRSFPLTQEQAAVFDCAFAAAERLCRPEGKGKKGLIAEWLAALALEATPQEVREQVLTDEGRRRFKQLQEIRRLRDAQLPLLAGGGSGKEEDEADEEAEDDGGPQDDLDMDGMGREEKVDALGEVAMKLAEKDGQVTADDLRAHTSDGHAVSQAFQGLVKAGHLEVVGEVVSRRPEAKGRRIKVFRAVGGGR